MRPIDKTPWRKLQTSDTNAYGAARQMVLTTTGFYCAYCESPLGVDMPVEHKAPKGGERAGDAKCFPDQSTKYYNFVMACSACNSTKNAHPNQDESFAFLRKLFPNVNTFDAMELLYGALYSMVWPDVITSYNDAPAVPQRLAQLYTGVDQTFKLFTYTQTAHSQADLATAGVLKLTKAEAGAAWSKTAQTMVWVLPNTTYINAQPNSAFLLARVKATLTTLGLNFYNPGDLGASDRRVQNRTNAAAVAAQALAELARMVDATGFSMANGYSGAMVDLVRVIRELALATGYWSTWMMVFSAITAGVDDPWAGLSSADRKALLAALLVRYEDNENRKRVYSFQPNPPPVFTGTDLTRVVL